MRESDAKLRDRTTEVPLEAQRPSPARRPAELHVVYPFELACRIEIGPSRLTLGRGPETTDHCALLHKEVSRQHFAIEWDAQHGAHVGCDLGSSNGSTVDGVCADTPRILHDGSIVRVGPALLVYECQPSSTPNDAETCREAIPGLSVLARALRAQVAHVARDPSPVLLSGETGVGKEFIARELHRLSGRDGPLIAINCAALASELLESELFGHVRGAFSGATGDSAGLFRAAHGGTLLLDEIGELPLSLQPKLLRALQESAVRPVGATRDVAIDVRVVAATHRELPRLVEAGRFRRDLYARLSLWDVAIPSLRKRRADLFLWLRRLYGRFLADRGLPARPLPALSAHAAEALLRCEFPDNLRGLSRLVHALSRNTAPEPLTVADLPAFAVARSEPGDGRDHASQHRRTGRRPIPTAQALATVLARHDGSVSAAARHFGRDRKQIYRWMQAYGLRDS